jgi:parallel beta-helix repeat protein
MFRNLENLGICLILLAVLFVTSANAGAKIISGCAKINESGYWELTQDIINNTSITCIEITVSNVVFDGKGHIIDGIDSASSNGILVHNSTQMLSNVTIINVTVRDWSNGLLFRNVNDSRIDNVTATSNSNGLNLSMNYSVIEGSTANYNDKLGIHLENSGNNVIVGNTANDNGWTGIYLHNSDNNKISGNIANNNVYKGIYLLYSDNNRVENNTVNDNDETGVYVGASGNVVNNNTIVDNYYGVDLKGSNNRIKNNTINSGLYGIRVYANNNRIDNNTIDSNRYGIYVEGDNTIIENNTMNNNWEYGIRLYFTINNVIKGNRIIYTGWYPWYEGGLYIYYSNSNLIYNNYIFNKYRNYQIWGTGSNTWNVAKQPGTNIIGGNYLGGNYWGNPDGTGFSQTCIDADIDGICDSAYTLATNNIDYLPLTNVKSIVSCRKIDKPGYWRLENDIWNNNSNICLEIVVSDVILDGNGHIIDGIDGASSYGIYVHNSTHTLTNITILDLTVRDWNAGIFFDDVNNSRIDGVIATLNGDTSTGSFRSDVGIRLHDVSNIEISSSQVYYNGDGIWLEDASNIVIKDSEIHHNWGDGADKKDGIRFNDNVHDVLIEDCQINENGYGIDIDSSGNTLAYNITIRNSEISYQYYYDGIYVDYGENITVVNNDIIDNDDSGIYFDVVRYATVRGNNISINGDYTSKDGIIAGLIRDSIIEDNIVSYNGNNGIKFFYAAHNTSILNNVISVNGYGGIYVSSINDSAIRNNTITHNGGDGVTIVKGENLSIINNTLTSNQGTGLGLSVNNSFVSDNWAINNQIGMSVDPSLHNIFKNLTLSQNVLYGLYLERSSFNIFQTITATNNSYGIYLLNSDHNTFNGGYARHNFYGIYLSMSQSNTITNFTITRNYYCGIYLQSQPPKPSIGNLIYNNYFSNIVNAYDVADNFWNVTPVAGTNIIGGNWRGGNYWSDYFGSDVDGDGLGDTLLPYKIGIAFGGDYHPLVASNFHPEANFTFNPSLPEVGETVNFIDKSFDPDGYIVSWFWDFGDGTTSNARNTTHAYSSPGNYTVSLTVTDDKGVMNTTTKLIRVIGVMNTAPVASFYIYPTDPTTSDTIQFIDTSFDPDGYIVAWFWQFGDGNTSDLRNPIHQYWKNGTYIVNLTVTDNKGATNTTSMNITVSEGLPVASFYWIPNDPTTGDTVQFIDTSFDPDGYIVAWFWQFGDGNTSDLRNPIHQYAKNGTYIINLTVTDNDGHTSTVSNTITVGEVPPIASFIYTPLNPTTSDVIQFTDTSFDPDGYIVAWHWDFGDGNTSDLRNPTHQYARNGTYTVTLTVIDNDGHRSTVSMDIVVGSLPPIASFYWTPHSPTTSDTVQFIDTSFDPDGYIVAWFWQFGDGNTSDLRNPIHQYWKNGTYIVNLTVTDNDGHKSTVSSIITVGEISPIASFYWTPTIPTVIDAVQFVDTSFDPDGYIVSWHWDFGDGNTSDLRNPTHQYASTGRYIITLTVTDNDGHKDTISANLTVRNFTPNASFIWTPTVPTTLDTVQFYDHSTDYDGYIVSWHWDFGDGNTSDLRNPTHQYAAPGIYTVNLTITDNAGATAIVTKQINVRNLIPQPSFTYTPQDPNNRNTILFTDTSFDPDGYIVSWHWDFGDGNTSDLRNPTHQYARNGTYMVNLTVTDNSGASSSVIKQVTVLIVAPVASFTYTPVDPTNRDTVHFTDHSTDYDGYIVSWHWDFGDGNTSDLRNPTHQYAAPGIYTVNLTITDNSGASSSVTKTVVVVNIPPIPSFTIQPSDPVTQQPIQFNDRSFDPDGYIVTWQWDFGDGGKSDLRNPVHAYSKPGTYRVTLTVIDNGGATNTITKQITVQTPVSYPPETPRELPKPPVASFTYSPTSPRVNEPVLFDASASYDEDGSISIYQWRFGDGSVTLGRVVNHTFTHAGKYKVDLIVIDDSGLQDSTWQIIEVVAQSGGSAADLDGSGTVDFNDLIAVLNLILAGSYDPAADLDGSGTVDFNDLIAVLNVILTS